jgi:ABC-2 type transport system ATP-binding protein
MIELVNLNKRYNNHFALEDLNIKVRQGEVYGFIGKNGAGKTTTINLILSLIHKDSGSIVIDGEEVLFTNQDYKKKIGYVPDVPVFPHYMNAKEYLKFTLDIYEVKENQDKLIQDVLDFVSLENNKKKISSYSRGMKQRLAIAQALIHDPEILIMDEPTSALDPIGRNDVMNIILELKGKKTIFYSTHILDDVEKVCDRIGIINNGNLILEETVDNLMDRFDTRIIHVETTSEVETLIQKVRDTNIVKAFKKSGKGLNVMLKDGFKNNDLIVKLLEKEEEILTFNQVKPSVEDIFLKEINHETA